MYVFINCYNSFSLSMVANIETLGYFWVIVDNKMCEYIYHQMENIIPVIFRSNISKEIIYIIRLKKIY